MLVPDPISAGSDWVKVLDFGIAKVTTRAALTDPNLTDVRTRADAFMGTPLYMSPEQWLGGQVDPRSDQFALCAALFAVPALLSFVPFRAARHAHMLHHRHNRTERDPDAYNVGAPGLRDRKSVV